MNSSSYELLVDSHSSSIDFLHRTMGHKNIVLKKTILAKNVLIGDHSSVDSLKNYSVGSMKSLD